MSESVGSAATVLRDERIPAPHAVVVFAHHVDHVKADVVAIESLALKRDQSLENTSTSTPVARGMPQKA